MDDFSKRTLIAIFALGVLTSIIMAFAPLTPRKELAGQL
jgi:hypothetical protein